MLHFCTILEEVSVWKTNGPIYVCGPEINRHKSSEIDSKTRSVRKLQNYQTASWNRPGWKRKSLAHKQNLLSKLNKRDIITIDKTKKFKKEAQCFVVSTLKKVFDRSPFTREFVRYCAVLNPVVLVSCKQKSCQKHFKLLLNELMKQIVAFPMWCCCCGFYQLLQERV